MDRKRRVREGSELNLSIETEGWGLEGLGPLFQKTLDGEQLPACPPTSGVQHSSK